MSDRPLPEFENPPVIEVVCGVQFDVLKNFSTPYFGLLWEDFKSEYPYCRDTGPLAPAIEQFEDSSQISPINFEIADTPPIPRVWYMHKNDNGIIQVQQDRFLHNWKKSKEDEPYPRYPSVIKGFKAHFNKFESFLSKNNLGIINPTQYEMTYVNHIPKGKGWTSLNQIGDVLADFNWDSEKKSFLPEIDNINFKVSFQLPNQLGRLHVSVRKGFRPPTKATILRMDLTVRGMSKEKTPESMWAWFDIAREWIVRGFADLTDGKIQKDNWGRKT